MIFHPSSKMSRLKPLHLGVLWGFQNKIAYSKPTDLGAMGVRNLMATFPRKLSKLYCHQVYSVYSPASFAPTIWVLCSSPITPSEECSKGAVSGTPWKRGSFFALQGVQCYSELGTPYACFLKVAKYFAERIQHCLNAIVYWKEIDDPGRNCDKTMCNISFEGVTKRGQDSGRTMTH